MSCLLKSTDDWYSAFDNSEIVGATFIDLRKAFDTVDHSLLCGKLERYGVRNNELRWFVSYLAGRKQFSRVNGTDSQANAVSIGYLKARVLALSYSLSISMIFLKS